MVPGAGFARARRAPLGAQAQRVEAATGLAGQARTVAAPFARSPSCMRAVMPPRPTIPPLQGQLGRQIQSDFRRLVSALGRGGRARAPPHTRLRKPLHVLHLRATILGRCRGPASWRGQVGQAVPGPARHHRERGAAPGGAALAGPALDAGQPPGRSWSRKVPHQERAEQAGSRAGPANATTASAIRAAIWQPLHENANGSVRWLTDRRARARLRARS